jgi:cytochrome c oxidase subunit I+III
MLITMLGDLTAFGGLVFGYFFYWTISADFPPPGAGPGVLWPSTAGALLGAAWLATLLARRWNRRGHTLSSRVSLAAGAGLALAGGSALVMGPRLAGLDPASHVYPAMVWVLVIWTVVHAGLGAIMQLYCLARSVTGRLTPRHDIDMANVALYWHFVALTALIVVAVVAGFPLVA